MLESVRVQGCMTIWNRTKGNRSIHTKGGRETIGQGVAQGAGNHKGRKADMVGQGQVKSVTTKVQAIIQLHKKKFFSLRRRTSKGGLLSRLRH